MNMATNVDPSTDHHHKHKKHNHKKHRKKHSSTDKKKNVDKKELVVDDKVLLQALTNLDDQLMKDSDGESTDGEIKDDEEQSMVEEMDRTTGQQCMVDNRTKDSSSTDVAIAVQDNVVQDDHNIDVDGKSKHNKKHSKKKKKHSKHKRKKKHHSRKHSSRSASRNHSGTQSRSRSRSRARSHSKRKSRSRSRTKRARSSSRTRNFRRQSHSRSRSRPRYSGTQRSRSRSRPRTQRSRSRSRPKIRHSRSRSRPRYSGAQRSRSCSKPRTQRSRSRSKPRIRHSRSRSRPRYSGTQWSRSRSRSRHRWTQSRSNDYSRRRYRSRSRSYSPRRRRRPYRRDNRRRSSSYSTSSDSETNQRDRTKSPKNIPTVITKPADIKKETIAEYTKLCQNLSENAEGADKVQHHPFQMNADIVPPGLTANQVMLEMKPVEQVFPVSSGKEHQNNSALLQNQPPTQESAEPVNVSNLVVERAMLQKQLKANSNDIHLVLKLSEIERKLANWSQGHVKPGLFTGGTEVTPMPKWEHDRGVQAWAKKNMFKSLAPVMSGFGMKMLMRMGWEMGKPLGKRGDGHVEPIPVDVKVDRQGLATVEDKQVPSIPNNVPTVTGKTSLAGKHPVSALQELCSKKSWGSPEYILISETGPAHMRSFMYKVTVDTVGTFQAACCSNNKKLAKAQAAIACLKALGIETENKNINENQENENQETSGTKE